MFYNEDSWEKSIFNLNRGSWFIVGMFYGKAFFDEAALTKNFTFGSLREFVNPSEIFLTMHKDNLDFSMFIESPANLF